MTTVAKNHIIFQNSNRHKFIYTQYSFCQHKHFSRHFISSLRVFFSATLLLTICKALIQKSPKSRLFFTACTRVYFSHLKLGTDPFCVALFPAVVVAAPLKMPVERSSALESRVSLHTPATMIMVVCYFTRRTFVT